MKKKLYTLLCLLCALALPFAAFAGEAEMDMELQGLVKEIVEGGFLMEDAEMGEVMLNTDETTVWDGTITEEDLAVGQFVMVQYDGRTTRSLPPQAHADRVICYTLEGVVSEVYEDGFMLSEVDMHGDVIVNTAETLPHVYEGMMVKVYFDGAMGMSLPAQVGGRYVEVPQVTGAVSEKTEEGFILTDDEGVEYEVLLTEETLVGVMEEPVIEVMDELAEETEAAEEGEIAEDEEILLLDEGTPDEAEAEAAETIEWGDGDRVTVYFSGIMTKSLPAQVTAVEVMVER